MHGNVVSEYCSRKWRKALRPQPWILCGNGGIPVPCPREKREAAEALLIGPHGLLSTQSTGRPTPEPPCEMRTCFQRDVDRITHSKSFRRLKHKTQVFLRPEGDHYRTRLTHTLEVARLARTIARALELNEDLTEAISLGHDLGHTPFGHAGERALNAIYTGVGFRHYEQSLRVVDRIERDGRGLNLCNETRIGILNHTTGQPRGTLEADVVRLADRVAYINHDLDDAMRGGIVQPEDVPAIVRERVGEDMMIGVSAHTVQEALDAVAHGADCLGVGAAFATHTKEDVNVLPRQTLIDICNAVDVPVVAIGGIHKDNILELKGSGVDGVALVSAIFSAKDIEAECRELKALSEQIIVE